MTSHKPTSVRNRPEYIRAAAESFTSAGDVVHDCWKSKFLEDLVYWVYMFIAAENLPSEILCFKSELKTI